MFKRDKVAMYARAVEQASSTEYALSLIFRLLRDFGAGDVVDAYKELRDEIADKKKKPLN